ncbi:hypothetical protein LDENG_00264470 [Lucifuga dentata]|nr:hypothetical protein LDENG_00264470 [Lucifuga dentata]
MCTNFSSFPSHIHWFRLVNRSKPSCIASMSSSNSNVSFCAGFQNDKFEMSSNVSMMFLTIKEVDLSDSGLYFCGFCRDNHTVIKSGMCLMVQDPDGITRLTCMILAGVTVVLVWVVIVLVAKCRKLQTAASEEHRPQVCENSDDLNYAALRFQSKPKRSRRPASDRQMESNVVYAATRKTQEETGTAAQS